MIRLMPRVQPVEGSERDSLYLRVLAHRPEIVEKWSELSRVLRFSGSLPPELKEELRRTTAPVVGCRFCASFGDPKAAHDDPREALAVRLARTVADDPKLVDDALWDELHATFSEAEIVELVATISFLLVGAQTFGAVMGIESASDEYALQYAQWLEDELAAARAV
jgi:alkylhydroperoxidase family enzyme